MYFLKKVHWPIEVLHALLFGPYKYLLNDVMSRLSKTCKLKLQAFMKAFDYSGFQTKPKPKRICHYTGSLAGRAFAQIAVFALVPHLDPQEMEVWVALSQVSTKLLYNVGLFFYLLLCIKHITFHILALSTRMIFICAPPLILLVWRCEERERQMFCGENAARGVKNGLRS